MIRYFKTIRSKLKACFYAMFQWKIAISFSATGRVSGITIFLSIAEAYQLPAQLKVHSQKPQQSLGQESLFVI